MTNQNRAQYQYSYAIGSFIACSNFQKKRLMSVMSIKKQDTILANLQICNNSRSAFIQYKRVDSIPLLATTYNRQ